MDIKTFLETCPIGKEAQLECGAKPKDENLISFGVPLSKTSNKVHPGEWVIMCPRLYLYCSECSGPRNFNPVQSYPFKATCINLGKGPRVPNGSEGIVAGKHIDQFLRFVCGDCNNEQKKYSLAIEILEALPFEGESANSKIKITKYGEIPKPIKPINNKIKRLIKNEWDLYRKGADDEAAGNGIGAFAYYRRVVESSRNLIVDAMCDAALKLNVPENQISKIQESKQSRNFTDSIRAVDSFFPSELKFNNQNALLVLYGPLSEGLHGKSDEECLQAAAHIRTLLDALGERLEQVIDSEEKILDAMKSLKKFGDSNTNETIIEK